MLLHVLGHVDTRPSPSRRRTGSSASALVNSVLPTPGGAEEQERTDGPVGDPEDRRGRGGRHWTRRVMRFAPGRPPACPRFVFHLQKLVAFALPASCPPGYRSTCDTMLATCSRRRDRLFDHGMRLCSGRSSASPSVSVPRSGIAPNIASSPAFWPGHLHADSAIDRSIRAWSSCFLELGGARLSASFSAEPAGWSVPAERGSSRLVQFLLQLFQDDPWTPRSSSFLQGLSFDLQLNDAAVEFVESPRAWNPPACAAGSPPRPSGRWPCRAGTGP